MASSSCEYSRYTFFFARSFFRLMVRLTQINSDSQFVLAVDSFADVPNAPEPSFQVASLKFFFVQLSAG